MSFGFIAFGLGATAATATTIGIAGATLASTAIQAKSAKKAGEREIGQSEKALGVIGERDVRTRENLAPFLAGETPEQQEQQALLGLQGPEALAEAEARLETPTTRALRAQGFRSLDQRLSAVGELGGSNRIQATIARSGDFDRQFSRERREGLSSLLRDRFNAAQVEAGFGVGAATSESGIIREIGRTEGDIARERGAAFQSGVEGFGSLALDRFGNKPKLKEFNQLGSRR